MARASYCGPLWFWRCSGILCWCDCVDDDQLSAAARAWQREGAERFTSIVDAAFIDVLMMGHFCPKQQPDSGDIGCTVAVSEEAIVTDAVLASGQHVDQEPADKLCRSQRHGGVAARTFETIIFDAESDTARVETDQAAVGYCHPVRVTRQIGQHGFGPGEGFFGANDPVGLAQGSEKFVEGIAINGARMFTQEVQLSSFVPLGQAFQNESSVQAGQNPDGQEEGLAAGDPLCTIRRQAPPGTNLITVSALARISRS